MAFFEELGEKISKGSQDAMQKTKDMANVVTLTNENNNLEKRNAAIKNQIGINVYDALFEKISVEDIANASNPAVITDELWTKLCQMATEIKNNEKIKADNSDKIRDLKGERLCPKCGKPLSRDAAFCTGCGEKLEIQKKIAAPSEKVCPNCGKEIAADATFCTGCGTKVVD